MERGTAQPGSAGKQAVVAVSRKIVGKADTCVSCPMCCCEIIMLNTTGLPREFSVQCPDCGTRKVYQADQVHDRRDDAETSQNPGRIKFGVRRTNDRDPKLTGPPLPKSRFNAVAGWLLQ
jgi:hypothetical protein